jgi:heme exporter protein D
LNYFGLVFNSGRKVVRQHCFLGILKVVDTTRKKKIKRKRILALSAFFVPAIAYADGGGPLLLIINFYLFTVGQVWILLAEFLYLIRVWPGLKKALVFKWTLFANLASTALGAFLLPFLWAAVFGLLASIPGVSESDLGGVFWATGTWILGDHSPYPWLAMTVSGVLFVLTYFVTVLVEYRLLKRFTKNQEAGVAQISIKQCYLLNLISYSGLVVLFALGTQWG